MATIRTRLARAERNIASERRGQRASGRLLMSVLCRAQVARQPELARVTDDDADAEALRYIRETLAWARGDWEEAERLRALSPPDDGYDQLLTDAGGDHGRALARLVSTDTPLGRARQRGWDAAVAAVRARAGIPTRD